MSLHPFARRGGLKMIRHILWVVLIFVFAVDDAGGVRNEIRIVGSAQVLPYVQKVAQHFTFISGFGAPSLEVTGTGNGFKLFCGGVGFEYPDINAASRRITDSEFANCQANGVNYVTEIIVGLDSIVLANSKAAKQYNFTTSQLFQAVAANVVDNGQIMKNTSQSWQEIDPALPDAKIKLMGPPPASGTYDAFIELIMESGCRNFSEKTDWSDAQRIEFCRNVRKDDAFVMGIKNDGLMIQWLQENHTAFGMLPFLLWQENDDQIAANSINGVFPTAENITNGRYALSRPIYIYVKTRHVDAIQGLQKFLYEFTSEHAIGPDGYLAEKGFIPLDDQGRNAARDSALSLAPIAR
jgi:phosphate transport system substrate-binding protein